jgi:hypothetical protein
VPAGDIAGRIVFGEDARPFQDATVDIVLEDTTYADARADPVARVVLRGASHDGSTRAIPFALPRPPAVPGRSYTLRVLVDVDGDGRLGPGDYRNAESVSILPDTRSLDVRVKRVG